MTRWIGIFGLLCATLAACRQEVASPTQCSPDGGPCALGEVCRDGLCVAGGCNSGCPDGQRCVADQCLPVTCPGTPCGAGQVCLSAVCTDEACVGKTCSATEACLRGFCYPIDCPGDPCAEDSVCVNSRCVTKSCVDRHCASDEVCRAGDCFKVTCSDLARDGSETDVDCGGACPSCEDGMRCVSPGDCLSRVCAGGICQVPSCSDSALNGNETDVDCGGPCPGCAVGRQCLTARDCIAGVCRDQICTTAKCTDGVQNGTETDLDCGGSCPSCADNERCAFPGDCTSRVCAGGICQAPSCQDDMKNGSETDRDCGGTCRACADERSCGQAADCSSRVCVDERCLAATCIDGVKNGAETDQDCGGNCPPCAELKGCTQANDCASRWCADGACRTLQEEPCEPLFEHDLGNHVSYLLTRHYYLSEVDGSKVFVSPCERSTVSFPHVNDATQCPWVMDDATMLGYQQSETVIETGALAGRVVVRGCSTVATVSYTYLGQLTVVRKFGPGEAAWTVPAGVTTLHWAASAGGGNAPGACPGDSFCVSGGGGHGNAGQAILKTAFAVSPGDTFSFVIGDSHQPSRVDFVPLGGQTQTFNLATTTDPCPYPTWNGYITGYCNHDLVGRDGMTIPNGYFGILQPSDNPRATNGSSASCGGPVWEGGPGGIGLASGGGGGGGDSGCANRGGMGLPGVMWFDYGVPKYMRPDGTTYVAPQN
ncbi:MAG: hypothetical protein HY901_04855 [Deltaproteobacteria bacterium]|nr:hypothetical protein [Deltaproteobacteria bacterium]